jgi:RND family efflux transporter MFP subunit
VFILKSNKETAQKRVYQFDKEKPVSVQTISVKSENPEAVSVFPGYFEAVRESKISADIQGKVNNVLVDLGSSVQKGQTVIQLDNSLLKLQLQSIGLQIEGLEKDVKRFTVLAEANAIQGVQLEKAELGLKSAKVQEATIMEQISKTTIRAPFNGIVTAKLTEEGAFAAPGMPLLQITDISNLNFTVNVPEKDLSRFKEGQGSRVSVDVHPEILLNGTVVVVGSKANMGNSFTIRLAVKNSNDLIIKSGMFGKVHLNTRSSSTQITIPAAALVGTTINPQVYLIKNGKARLQDITVSDRIENKVVVAQGLTEGDVIVTSGFINLYNGANVILK